MSRARNMVGRNWPHLHWLILVLLGCNGCRSLGVDAKFPWKLASKPAARDADSHSKPTAKSQLRDESQSQAASAIEAYESRPYMGAVPQVATHANWEPPQPPDASTPSSMNTGQSQPIPVPSRTDSSESATRHPPGQAIPQPTREFDVASSHSATIANGTTAPKPTTSLLITGIRANAGPVRMAVFTNLNSFPSADSADWTSVVEPMSSTVSAACPITGWLAVAAYQDLNNDGELTRNRFGIPLEPYAFSNGAKADRGPPTFSAAAVDATAAGGKPIQLALP